MGLRRRAVDHMTVVDDVAMFAILAAAAPARQGHERGGGEEQFEPIVVEPHAEPLADQPRWHRVEHLPECRMPPARR